MKKFLIGIVSGIAAGVALGIVLENKFKLSEKCVCDEFPEYDPYEDDEDFYYEEDLDDLD